MPRYSVHLPPTDGMKGAINELLSRLPVMPITEHRLHTTIIYFPAESKELVHEAVRRSLPEQFPLYAAGCGIMRKHVGAKLLLGFTYAPQIDIFHARIIKHLLESGDPEFSRTYRPDRYPQMRPHMAIAKVAEDQDLEGIAGALDGYRWDVQSVDVVEDFNHCGKRFELTTTPASQNRQARPYR